MVRFLWMCLRSILDRVRVPESALTIFPLSQSNATCSVSFEAPLSARHRLHRFGRGQLPRLIRLTAHASANNSPVYRFCSSFP